MPVQIQVSDGVWNELRLRKVRPSHTFDEIIRELLFKDSKSIRTNLQRASEQSSARKMTTRIAEELKLSKENK